MEKENKIILVDEKDNQIGVGYKNKVHKEGKLHRAFSIFIFNSKGELLLQKRNKEKYHSGGLWTNTCCSHPLPNESVKEASKRRLKEEMGIICDLEEIHSFVYKKKFDNGLTEYEYDHVLIGKSDADPKINEKEAEDWKWVNVNSLKKDLENNPEKYTYWLRMSFYDILSKI
ncbi:MAG: isopentenyl-diphosphate Delta-isomerase [Candidatus Pacebacteria bacterium]|nr:isopentenyl-diphosphate Delta-isomerase [Candidatus Paceibacterota bacterium]MDD3729336.1 isopentenyl-diphosphate Delta-isomerase [Candidatus Paceibacterota bacterium]MDD4201511.1 isopentenyl-diphosphate Delta-isomerase [Candidatus Paceibacterota bacterium]MDD5446101.1 isopentenyl-diphosphate Delta-isomerase [Candidatus Paceibacterota bacterium]